MEFWGIEVKPGESLKVKPDLGQLIHISQASLGEVKDVKGAKNAALHLKIDGKDMVFGSLSGEERPQIMCDLVFEKEFELSHGWKSGSVFFLGYKADDPADDDEAYSDFSDSEEEEEAVPKAEKKAEAAEKPIPAPRVEEAIPEAEEDDSSDSDSEDDDDSESDDTMRSGSSEEEEAVPQYLPQPTKKRPAESLKNAASGKKAKPNQKGSPFAGKGNGKPQQQGGSKFNKGQKGKAGGQRR